MFFLSRYVAFWFGSFFDDCFYFLYMFGASFLNRGV